jgi:hypothetical protein
VAALQASENPAGSKEAKATRKRKREEADNSTGKKKYKAMPTELQKKPIIESEKQSEGCEINLDEVFVKEANDMVNNLESYHLMLEHNKPSPDCVSETNEDFLQEINEFLSNTESDNIDIGLWETYLECDYEIPDMFC